MDRQISVSVDETTLTQIDAYAIAMNFPRSRAARRLLHLGLQAKGFREILDKPDR